MWAFLFFKGELYMIEAQKLIEQLNWRYAVKKFDPTKKIDAKTWDALEEALTLTASSYGAMPFKFIVVENQELKNKLQAASYNQSQVGDCSHHVVFLAKVKIDEEHITKFINRTAEVRNQTPESLEGFKAMMNKNLAQGLNDEASLKWATNQVYIALGNFLTSCAVLGVDACPFEGINKKKYDEILELAGTGWTTVCACPTGYRSSDDKYNDLKKVRFAKEDMIVRL